MSNILIVEDSDEFKHVYVELFAMYSYNVTAVSTGKGIDTVIENFKPDIILLDIYLGSENGTDICREIKQIRKSIPVIMVSICTGLEQKAATCGDDDYVKKPFEISHLIGKVSKWTRNISN